MSTVQTASGGGLQKCPRAPASCSISEERAVLPGGFQSGNIQLPVCVGLLGDRSSAVALSLRSSLRAEK